jgi:regulator of sirC expression with transglutaminase-like and TPR domain
MGLLFGDEGFAGDDDDYHHPDNSFLDRVLERRRGLPILLSILGAEVGARAGVCLAPVGMPGHFLLRDCADPERFFDPFHGGRPLDRGECAALFRQLHPGAPFDEAYLDPVDSRSVLVRVVTNLVRTYTVRGPLPSLGWALHLRALLVGGDAWLHVARVRERLGDWAGAAVALDEHGSADARAKAAAVRARAN